MPTLTATFELEVSSPALLAIADEEEPREMRVFAMIESYKIDTTLVPAWDWREKTKDDPLWTTGLALLRIAVSHDEAQDPPSVVETPDGKRDYAAQSGYLYAKLPEYQRIAREAANRVLLFFRYKLLTPSIRLFPRWAQALSSPTWFNSSGEELRGGRHMMIVPPVPGTRGELCVQRLSVADLTDLQAFLSAPEEPSLELTLLSDAQTAWFEKSPRRAVIELAICAEVMVKRWIFPATSPAGAAFDYLEDRSKTSVKVLELLDAVALEAFGRSYKRHAPEQYRLLDYLFRCRNKVAHRAELVYRDDCGRLVSVDSKVIESWWLAVYHLKSWIGQRPP